MSLVVNIYIYILFFLKKFIGIAMQFKKLLRCDRFDM